MLTYNKTLIRFDKLDFVDTEVTSFGSCTLKSLIYLVYETPQKKGKSANTFLPVYSQVIWIS